MLVSNLQLDLRKHLQFALPAFLQTVAEIFTIGKKFIRSFYANQTIIFVMSQIVYLTAKDIVRMTVLLNRRSTEKVERHLRNHLCCSETSI